MWTELRRRSSALVLGAVVAAWTGAVASAQAPIRSSASLDLAGEWRVHGGDVPAASDPRFDDRTWRTATLPFAFLEVAAPGGRVIWMRRHIRLPLGTNTGTIAVAIGVPPGGRYDVWVGGRVIGRVDGTAIAEREHRRLTMMPLPRDALDPGGGAVVAVRYEVAPWVPKRRFGDLAPLGRDFAIGALASLDREVERLVWSGQRRNAWKLVLATVLLVLGIHHLSVVVLRRDAVDAFRYGVLAVSAAALLTVGAGLDLDIPAVWVWRARSMLEHVCVAAGIFFLWPFLGRARDRWVDTFARAHVALGALVWVPGVLELPAVADLRLLTMLPAPLVATASIAEAWWRRRQPRALGIAILVPSTVGLAALLQPLITGRSASGLGVLALAGFALVGATGLTTRFNRLYHELDDLRWRLERMVGDRTDELISANQRLENEVAERRLAEEAMRMLERAVEQSRDGIAVLDPAGRVQFVNQAWAEMHGYQVHETLGNSFSIFYTPEQMHLALTPRMREVEATGAWEGEIEHRHRDASTFPTWMSITRLRDSAQQPVGFVAIARDISRRRREAEERLHLESRVQRARRLESLASLAGGIAHDYNNLLTAILSNAGLARRQWPADVPGIDKIERIERAAEEASELSHQLLSYAGEQRTAPQPMALNELLSSVRDELESMIRERATLELQLKPDLPLVEMDADQIRQMVRHLATNAVESLGADRGFITLRTSRMNADSIYLSDGFADTELPTGEYVFLEVSDSGMGIDEATLGRIFEPKFTTKEARSGMGLAAVLGIVRSHGGTVKVFSQTGRGTTVQILFPPVTPAATPSTTDLDRQRGWSGEGTVLVVDDQSYVLDVCVAILGAEGLEVLTASSGVEAIDLYRRHGDRIGLVLLDWTMPDMNGEQVFREIRHVAPHAAVVLMSGYEEGHVMTDLSGLGLAGFLHKPFKPEEVVAKVREAWP